MMTTCSLCFNNTKSSETLHIDQCSHSDESGVEMLRLHFSFADKILGISKVICSSCWTSLSAFHTFHCQVSSNYQLTTRAPVSAVIEIPFVSLEDVRVKVEEDFEDFPSHEETVKIEPLENPKKDEKTSKNSQKHHNTEKAAINVEKIRQVVDMKCDICKSDLKNFSHALKHFKVMHGVRGYLVCCGKRYLKKHRLLDHLNSHFNITFPCDTCGKTFFTKDILKRHKICHEETRLFECDHCQKSFASKFQVRNHLHNVHLNEKRALTFACTFESCTKSFVSQLRLDHHRKYTHAGGDQLICEVCSKTFAKRSYLDEHMRIHLRSRGEKNDRFKCHVCQHWITGEREFKRHVKNHETEAWDNVCPHCDRKSKNLRTLKKHIYVVHRKEAKHKCEDAEAQKK